MSRGKWKDSHIPTICDGCGITFQLRRCKIIPGKKVYHNRECYVANCKQLGGGIPRSKYLTHYFCKSCQSWILHEFAVMYTSKSGMSTYPTCPNKQCGSRYKLNTRPHNSKWNERFREQQQLLTCSTN